MLPPGGLLRRLVRPSLLDGARHALRTPRGDEALPPIREAVTRTPGDTPRRLAVGLLLPPADTTPLPPPASAPGAERPLLGAPFIGTPPRGPRLRRQLGGGAPDAERPLPPPPAAR